VPPDTRPPPNRTASPLDRVLDALSRAHSPRVRAWARALLERGEVARAQVGPPAVDKVEIETR